MSNWIEGTFRVRGSLKNVKQFIDEGLGTVSSKQPPIKIEYDSLLEKSPKVIYAEVISGWDEDFGVYIKDSRRQFICVNGDSNINICRVDYTEDMYLFAVRYKGAWQIDRETMQYICKKYHLDVKVNGYENGGQFEEIYELRYLHLDSSNTDDFFVVADTSKEYKGTNWEWDCLMPNLGG